jgi:rhamnogalacturonyl hydrolase YesR
MSQIMALNQLAPDIQEALLNLPATKGKPEIHEKRLRPIAAMLRWEDQRGAWRQICDEVGLRMDALAESADRF